MNSNPSPNQPSKSDNPELYAHGSFRYLIKIVDQKLGKEATISVSDLGHLLRSKWGHKKDDPEVIGFIKNFRDKTHAK